MLLFYTCTCTYLILIYSKGWIGKPHGHHWSPVVEDKFSATIVVYGESQQTIDAGINGLEKSLDGEFETKTFQDPVISKLSKNQVCFRDR